MTCDIHTLAKATDEQQRRDEEFEVDGLPNVLFGANSATSIVSTDERDEGVWLAPGVRAGTTSGGEVIWIETNAGSSPPPDLTQPLSAPEFPVNLSYIDEHLREAYARWIR